MSGFNSSLPAPMRTIVQAGVLEILRPMLRESGGYLSKVSAWGGLVRTYTNEVDLQFIEKELGPGPAIAVTTGTRQFESTNVQRTAAKSDIEVVLYFLTQHQRDLGARMLGDRISRSDRSADPGLHTIMEHTLELMHGTYPHAVKNLVKQIQITVEEELATLPELTIWTQTYMVTTMNHTVGAYPEGGASSRFTPGLLARQLLNSIGWRVTADPDETERPASATSSTTIDADTET